MKRRKRKKSFYSFFISLITICYLFLFTKCDFLNSSKALNTKYKFECEVMQVSGTPLPGYQQNEDLDEFLCETIASERNKSNTNY